MDETEATEEAVGTVGESPLAEALKWPSPATIREIMRLSEQVDELECWLEEESATAKDRGRDPHLRPLEANEAVVEK